MRLSFGVSRLYTMQGATVSGRRKDGVPPHSGMSRLALPLALLDQSFCLLSLFWVDVLRMQRIK